MILNPASFTHSNTTRWLIQITLCCLTVALIGVSAPKAQSYPDSSQLDYFRSVQRFLFNENYLQADSVNESYAQQYPSDPAGYLFKASVLLAVMTDREENLFENEFKRLIDTVMVLSEAVMDTCRPSTSAWMALWRGNACTYLSLWESRFGSTIAAVRNGFRAKGEYELGLAFDSSLHDMYMGLGAFHYWKSAKAGILRRLRFFRNDKDKGIAELRKAAESSVISAEAARNALIWIRLDMKEYDSAITICGKMIAKHPDGKLFWWPLAQAYYATENWQGCIDTYTRLRELVAVDPGNYFNLVECDYYLLKCYEHLNDSEKAKATAEAFLRYEPLIPQKTRDRQDSKITTIRQAAY